MSDEVLAFALRNTLNEIEHACPSVSHTFIFKDTKILASDENTTEETINSAVNAFNAIAEYAKVIGGIESATLQCTNGQVNITRISDFYMTTVTSKETDEKNVNTLIQVLIPIVLKLLGKIHLGSTDEDNLTKKSPLTAENNPVEVCGEEPLAEETALNQTELEALLPRPPVDQLMVETLSGFLAPSDKVLIDNAVILQWKNLYVDRKIEEVEVETLTGKKTCCKFRSIKELKHARKGMIQMPERILLALQTKNGDLVMVKPVVE